MMTTMTMLSQDLQKWLGITCRPFWKYTKDRTKNQRLQWDPRDKIDGLEDDIGTTSYSLGKTSGREKFGHMERLLVGDGSEFVLTLSSSGRSTLDEVLTRTKESFRGNRSQTDFLKKFTMRRQSPKHKRRDDQRRFSWPDILVTKAYLNTPETHRMEVLKQKFLSSIKVEDFKRRARTHDLTAANDNQVVNTRSSVEFSRKSKQNCQQKIIDWYLKNEQPRENQNKR